MERGWPQNSFKRASTLLRKNASKESKSTVLAPLTFSCEADVKAVIELILDEGEWNCSWLGLCVGTFTLTF